MEVRLKRISEAEFHNLHVPILFDDKVTGRCFGVVTNGDQSFGLAWQSTMTQPILSEVGQGVFCIGIDQNFAVMDFSNNSVPLRLTLFYNFYNTQLYKESIFVITELEIIKIDRTTFKVMGEYALPEYFEEITIGDDSLEVKCVDGRHIQIK